LDELTHIIEGCRRNDRVSQERLYRQFYPALFALCKTFFDDGHEAVTALNNGMLKVYQNIGQFDTAKGTFFNWAYTIVRNAALTLVRNKESATTFEYNEDIDAITSSNPFANAEWKDVYVYLARLPATTRVVCSLFYLEGFAIKEIAAALQIKEGTVKWHLAESRSRLKTILKSNYP
jgi:RNA polymerase sigma-70 factor (ECF subfamily)